jgi:hypothetical protein
LPAASVAVALNVVDESSARFRVKPGVAKVAAEPLATGAPEQSEVVYSLTVEPASAEPVISGSFSFAGEPGEEFSALGAAGAVESSVYATPLEQLETLPAASVAVALKVVDESSATLTLSPAPPNAAAPPVVTGAPEQSLEV